MPLVQRASEPASYCHFDWRPVQDLETLKTYLPVSDDPERPELTGDDAFLEPFQSEKTEGKTTKLRLVVLLPLSEKQIRSATRFRHICVPLRMLPPSSRLRLGLMLSGVLCVINWSSRFARFPAIRDDDRSRRRAGGPLVSARFGHNAAADVVGFARDL